MENYHSDCDINLDCNCHHLGCDQLYALNGNRNNKQKVPVGEIPIGTFFGKNLRRLRGYFLSHRFHRCTQIFLHSPDVSSHADLAFPSAADFQFADFADFLPFYPFKFPHGSHESHGFFTFLLFYLFTFKQEYKMLTPKVSFLPMKHLNHRNETIFLLWERKQF